MSSERPAITPQLALRTAVLGGVALTLFAIVFFRLWFLQVLSGEQYVSQARENRTRIVRVAAPRGEILDRSGHRIVINRNARVVQISPDKLPDAERTSANAWGKALGAWLARPRRERRRVPAPRLPPIATPELRARFVRLGRVLGMRATTIHRRVMEQLYKLPYAAVTLRSDVPFSLVAYLKENKRRFPGVDVEEVYLRRYPYGQLAAQSLGYVGQITKDQLELKRYRGVAQGTVIGQAGLEYTYDRYLRGQDGARILRVNADGQFIPDRRPRRRDPVPGRDLVLSLDYGLQKAGQEAMAAIGGGLPGAFVAMNPRNGEIYALGSYPSFDPTVYTKPLSQRRLNQLTSEEQGAPLVNRAIAGAYPSGSTFKPITSLAALDSGVITPGDVVSDGGCITIGNSQKCNAGRTAYGGVDMARALQVSSDVYYYKLGIGLAGVRGEPLQSWAKRLGLGHKTGIDLPEEQPGLIPGKAWRSRINKKERRCQKNPKQHGRPCYVLDIRPYNFGDNANLAVGQGEVQIDPLQMAVAYSTIITGGRVPRPHLGQQIQDANGRLVQDIKPDAARRVKIDPTARATVMEGIRRAAEVPGGTSQPVFAGWPHARLPVYGKTGTAEVPNGAGGYDDQSWYVAYVPNRSRPIVIATTIERGGFGAERAAPATCRMLRQWFSQPRSVCEPPVQKTGAD